MNKELRWKLARMILEKSKEISTSVQTLLRSRGADGELQDIQIDFAIHSYFQKLGFQRVYEGYEIEEAVPWQATPGSEGPHLLFTHKPEQNHLHFSATAPMLTRNAMVMKIDRETAEKILVIGLP